MWQKYEDVLNEQIDNEFLHQTMEKLKPDMTAFMEDEDEFDIDYTDHLQGAKIITVPVPIPSNLDEEITLISNFDCWVGHTNFDLSKNIIAKHLVGANGVEALKIISRYRFFIGVGRMFKFSDVRRSIERNLL